MPTFKIPFLGRRSAFGDALSITGALSKSVDQAKASLPWRLRKLVYQNMIDLLPQGEDETAILGALRANLQKRKKIADAQAIHRVYVAVVSGKTLLVALGKLPPTEASMLAAGAASGAYPKAMQQILELRERVGRITGLIAQAVTEPSVYMAGLYGFCYVIGSQVTPTLTDAIPPENWSTSTRMLYVLGWIATSWFTPVAGAIALMLAIACVIALPRWTGPGRAFFDQHVFPFTLYRELIGAAWLDTFSRQIKSGIAEGSALEQQMKLAAPWLASRLRPLWQGIRRGEKLSVVMRATGHGFPSMDLIERIAMLQGKSNFANVIEVAAQQFGEKVERRIRWISVVLGTVFTLFVMAVGLMINASVNSLMSDVARAVGF
ncbi:type II secretion system F family protein [Burkholderia gladioli]|uniref:type II secretion system F family protein n=1 Tax=Burkholderia gladioli TaxID=28095 RepID=UPI001C5E2441|nr:type II secretion system F family protein [Burkholderia gladioli]MBW5286506.1 type II secretion system F family protein [Burkholderia gladioli]